MPVGTHERRRYGRIDLDDPLSAFIDDQPVTVIEVSVVGFKIQHDARFDGNVEREMRLDWRNIAMRFDCTIVRSTLYRLARRPGEKSIYHSGVRITRPHGDSEMVLRNLIAERVIRALEEQKANARGYPPIGEFTYQIGKGDRYLRCEMEAGRWKKSETSRPDQPQDGFTISAEIENHQIDLLCNTYAMTTSEGRRLTKILAELSIDKREGTPVRRYVP